MQITIPDRRTVDAVRIEIQAKCSDMCRATLIAADGIDIKDHDGYVPDFMPGDHFGDYIILNIDLATGQILNWTPPTAEQLEEFVSQQ